MRHLGRRKSHAPSILSIALLFRWFASSKTFNGQDIVCPGQCFCLVVCWSYYRGGAVPGGGGGNELFEPVSSGVMRRMVTRLFCRSGPSVGIFRYCSP